MDSLFSDDSIPIPSPIKAKVDQEQHRDLSLSPFEDETSKNSTKRLLDDLDEDLEDVGKIKKKFMSRILNDDEEFNSSQVPVDTISRREVQDMIENIPKPLFQRSLQPGASPRENDNRFLCWNSVGIIRGQFGKEEQCIDVMFHDSEKHSSINLDNQVNYCFGSMSDDAIVVGSNGKYGSGPATLKGINLLEGGREEREWDIELPHVELIEALAVGRGFVAVATDLRNLRLFTHGGMQSYVLTLPGSVLSLAAHEKQLMIIYHNGTGQRDEQNLAMQVDYIDLINNELKPMITNVGVALSRRAPLSWCGFSDEGTPCTYDHMGMVRMYKQELAEHWIPILDLRELTSSALDHFFVVGLSELSQAVRAVRCKRSRFPDFTCEISESFGFTIPLCELDTDKGKLEEEYVRLQVAEVSYSRLSQFKRIGSLAQSKSDANEKMLVNNILRLFAYYLKENRLETALNLVYMIPFNYMTKLPEFAWKTKKPTRFIDQLNQAIEKRKDMEEELAAAVATTNHTNKAPLGDKENDKDLYLL